MKAPVEETILRIVLIRHGETNWNRNHRFQGRSDIELNEKGRSQAAALALTLRNESLKAIYASPITRAVETAKIINNYHQVPIEQRDGLMEMDLGDFDGIYYNDFMKEQPEFLKKWMKDPASVRMSNGESLQEVQERAWGVVEEIAETYYEGSVLLCGHNFVNIMILCKVLGLEINHFRRLRQSLGSINIIEKIRGQYFIICLNDTCHLKSLVPTF